MSVRILIVTSVEAERAAIGAIKGVNMVVSGVGRTNAAAATTETILRGGPFHAVINAGIAGSLPGSNLAIGDAIIASQCVYVEEGIVGPAGFSGMTALGVALGDFAGNVVPVDRELLDAIRHFPNNGIQLKCGPIATVATCSGTNAAAAEVVRRTGALAEAMEGAAVVHAARRLATPAIEVRVISNTTGDRPNQRWDIAMALKELGPAVSQAVEAIRAAEVRIRRP